MCSHSATPRSANISDGHNYSGRTCARHKGHGNFQFKCSKCFFPSPLLPTAARSSVMAPLAKSGHSRHGLLLASLGTKHQKVSTLTRSEKDTSVRMVNCWNRMQSSGRCPKLGNIQSQLGWGSGQWDPGEGVPAHCRGLLCKGLFQNKPSCDSTICCLRLQS